MEPNNALPQSQPTISPAPSSVIQSSQQPAASVTPHKTNYAATVFFTLLIIGFTFQLPTLLYVPIMFFCIAAGILFFRDARANRHTPQAVPGQPGVYYAQASAPAPHKRRSLLVKILLIIFGAIGVGIILYIGLIVFVLIMLGSSGV